ncbi:uncharacterized protein [Apostichopus japonicus]|uniref:uncharacterized protein isoform X2 n=1 Tax=Stichopus japonicus TaxID=307972 RepID=UPI003AB7E5FA
MPVIRTYSNRYQHQDKKDEMEDMSVDYINQQATRDRVRKLSAETNRRRRALEQKKKLEAQKEAKRRSEVLEERRKRQQEATQRYQRLSRASPKKTPSRQDAVYSGPRLQEGVQMAKGYKFNDTSGKPSPAMEDVLRMVGHQENPPSSGYTQPPITSDNHSGFRGEQLSREVSSLDRNGNAIKRGPDQTYHQKYHGYTTHATTTHDTPASPVVQQQHHPRDIQQELVNQQRLFIEQQKKSLMEFNQALRQGSASKNVELDCSSVSSLDSLEEGKKPTSRKLTFDDQDSLDGVNEVGQIGGRTFQSTTNGVRSGHLQENMNYHQSEQHQPVERNTSLTGNVVNGPFSLSHPTSEGHPYQNQDYGQNSLHYSQYSSTQPTENESDSQTSHFQSESHSSHVATLTAQESNRLNIQSHVWDHSTAKAENTASSKRSSPQATADSQTSQRYHGDNKTRGFSTKTSATPLVSVTANQKLTKRMDNDRGQPLNKAVTKQGGKPLQRNCEEGSSNSDLDMTSPKSILKKTSKYSVNINQHQEDTPSTHWGKNELRDSMDIASATQIKRTPSKKSVRWTDLAHSDYSGGSHKDVQSGKTVGLEAKSATETQKTPATNARIVQQKLAASNDMEQTNSNGTASVSRNTFRSKFGNQNGKSASHVQSKNEAKSVVNSRNHSTPPMGKPPSGKSELAKFTPKRMNGFTLNKTPTDEEINQLWNKVRTCLHSREASPEPRGRGVMRRAASDQSLAESNPRLTANFRIVPPNRDTGPEQNKLKKYHTVPRWRTSSDSGTNISKRAAMLQRQQDQHSKRTSCADSRKRTSSNLQAPITSHGGPNRSAGSHHQYEVDNSLMAFQQAELLAQQNLSESEIEAALEHRVSDHPLHENNVPSALSLEEQRILESLDRLNEKLRITSDISTNYSAMTPRPPAYITSQNKH